MARGKFGIHFVDTCLLILIRPLFPNWQRKLTKFEIIIKKEIVTYIKSNKVEEIPFVLLRIQLFSANIAEIQKYINNNYIANVYKKIFLSKFKFRDCVQD